MPSWMNAFFDMFAVPFHNEQANNPHFGNKKNRNNWDQRQAAKKARVEKRRAKKKKR